MKIRFASTTLVRVSLACALALAVAGCQTGASAPQGPGMVPTDGRAHSEPVMYNGQRYQVTFRFEQSMNGYELAVSRRGRGLKDHDKDRKDAFQVAASALTHFACPRGQKAKLIDGSQTYSKPTWRTNARCA